MVSNAPKSPSSPTTERWQRFAGSASSTAGVAQALSPQNMLHENEVVILMLRPSVWYILVTSSRYIIIVLVLALLGETSAVIGRWISIPTMATIMSVLIFCRLLYGVMEWIGHHYILTNCRLITLQGLLQPQISQAILSRVSAISLKQTTMQKILRTGSLTFTMESSQSQTITWQWIRSPQRVEQQIRQAISRYRGKMGG